MTTVKSTLHRHLQMAMSPHLGAGVTTLNRKQLAADLMAVSRTNQTYFFTCFAVIVLVLAGAGAVAMRFLDSPAEVSAIFGALGLSVTGLITQLISLWKQKVTADTVLVLCRNLDETTLKPVLDVLLAKI